MANGPAAPTTYPVLTAGQLAAVPRGVAPPARGPSLAETAAALAHSDVQAQKAAYQQVQQQDLADAATQAAQIRQASQAAAGFLGPGGYNLGGLTAQDYQRAIDQTRGLAAGYSGQLRSDVQGAAGAAQNTLGGIPGNDQTITDRGGSLANALYGLQGSLPGQALAAEGLAATTTARLLPAQLLATGQNQALGVIGAGRQEAARLLPQIATAEGKLPGLTQQYLGTLSSQALKQQQLVDSEAKAQADQTYKNDYLKHLQNGDSERVAHDKAIEAAGEKYHTATLALAGQRLGVERFNAQTSRINANKPPSSQIGPSGPPRFDSTNSNTNKYRSDQYGNPLGGKITPLPGYKVDKAGTGVVSTSSSARGGPSPPSAQDLQKDIGAINTGLDRAVNGYTTPATKTTKAVVHPPLSGPDALAELHAAGWFATPQLAKIALAAWKRAYASTGSPNNIFSARGGQNAIGKIATIGIG